jgi:hypothetical protein
MMMRIVHYAWNCFAEAGAVLEVCEIITYKKPQKDLPY